MLDALVTVMASIPDLKKTNALSNSRTGSIYIVKPKMHGPEEVAFVAEIFSAVEEAFGLEHATVKLGIMDEERRTTANLRVHTYAIRPALLPLPFFPCRFLVLRTSLLCCTVPVASGTRRTTA